MFLRHQLEIFQSYSEALVSRGDFKKIDDFGFCSMGGKGDKIDLLVSGLVHGDEIIGLEVINNILLKILKQDYTPQINIGFLLCNVEAYKINARYCHGDLNRLFGNNLNDHFENQRARQIESIIKESRAVFDIHQTIGSCLTPFFIFPFNQDSIKAATYLDSTIPQLTFSEKGFSSKGQTLLEFAKGSGCLTVSIEAGQKGFNPEIASSVERMIYRFMDYLVSMPISFDQHRPKIYRIYETIYFSEGDELLPGFQSCQPVRKGEILGRRQNNELIISPFDSLIFFPKYGDVARSFGVLLELARLNE